METLKDRLITFIAYKGYNNFQFEKICNFGNGTINNSRGNFSQKKLDIIIKTFPELSLNWLITGEGEMLRTPAINQKGGVNIAGTNDVKTINNINASGAQKIIKPNGEVQIQFPSPSSSQGLETENQTLKRYISMLEQTIKDKEDIISLLKDKTK